MWVFKCIGCRFLNKVSFTDKFVFCLERFLIQSNLWIGTYKLFCRLDLQTDLDIYTRISPSANHLNSSHYFCTDLDYKNQDVCKLCPPNLLDNRIWNHCLCLDNFLHFGMDCLCNYLHQNIFHLKIMKYLLNRIKCF